MIEISNQANICTECEKAFKHKRINIQLLDDFLPRVRFITCHSKCCKQKQYDALRKHVKEFFLDKGVLVIDI